MSEKIKFIDEFLEDNPDYYEKNGLTRKQWNRKKFEDEKREKMNEYTQIKATYEKVILPLYIDAGE